MSLGMIESLGCYKICLNYVCDGNGSLSDLGFCSIDELKHESCEIETLGIKNCRLIVVLCCVNMCRYKGVKMWSLQHGLKSISGHQHETPSMDHRLNDKPSIGSVD